ncbi:MULTISPECIES: FRG domain-containing protein [Pseudolactococcus]|nr:MULTISPECIES: FRG domain-containing protein [Lactococcus]MCJ1972074.1 FRG domain-containing protein [Lactococcus carnosus]MCJ2002266.1 FRG domain-containing protein [Lactococcus carnosus]
MKQEIMTVKSLDSFIKIINSFDNKSFLYRGESKYYDSGIIASAYREINNFNNKKILLDYEKIRNEYYREIGSELTATEKKNFIGYCQHHGLPTELIDVTKNPLVSLYFSCLNTNESTGYVYLFEDDLTIDITSLIEHYSYNFDEISLKSVFVNYYFVDELYKQLMQYYCNDKILLNNYLIKILNFIKSDSNSIEHNDVVSNNIRHLIKNQNVSLDNLSEICRQFITDESIITQANKYADHINRYSQIDGYKMNWQISGNPYYNITLDSKIPFWIIFLLQKLTQNNDHYIIDEWENIQNILINIPSPYFVYKPSVIFDRIKYQDGNFLYQLNFKKIKREDNIAGTTKFSSYGLQQITPFGTIKIQNKKRILKELDNIGINKKNLFHDHDSVAKYIIEKNSNFH